MRSVFAVVTAALLLSCAPAAATPGGGWSARAEDLFERSGAPGMVAVVVHGDRIVWAAGFGRDGHSEPMTARSPVQIASLSKSFTAVVVARLARAEGIDLDQPVAGGRPDLTVADTRHRAIRLRHLLTHTSGLTDAGVHYWRTVDDGAASLDDHVRALRDERLSAAPGTTFRYANINYVLLGAGAEQVSGRPFSALLRETVLTPAGLAQTTPDAAPEPRGFNSLFGWWVPRTDTSEVMRGNPAGGLSSTAKDLGRWMTIVNGHGPQALDPATRRILESPPPASEGYGAGWQTDEHLPGWWGHAGNRYTHSGHMMRNPTRGWGVAVVVDGATMTDPAYDIANGLVAAIDGRPGPDIPDAVASDRWAAAVLLGALALSGILVLRSRAWARRARGRRLPLILGLVAPCTVMLAVALTPWWAGRLMGGIDLTWSMMTYFSLTPLLTVLGCGLGATAVLVARGLAVHQARDQR